MRTFFSGLYTASGDYRSSAPGGSAKGPSSRLTVADHRGPDAVSPQKCPRSPLKAGDLERFDAKSARGLLKILRYAQDDSVDIRIGMFLKGVASCQKYTQRDSFLWGRA